jgi:hypothetical protein
MGRTSDQSDAAFAKLRQAMNDFHHDLEEQWRENAALHGHPAHTLRAIYEDVAEALLLLETARGRASCIAPDLLVTKIEAARSMAETLGEIHGVLDTLGAQLPLKRRVERALSKARVANVAGTEELAAGEWRTL